MIFGNSTVDPSYANASNVSYYRQTVQSPYAAIIDGCILPMAIVLGIMINFITFLALIRPPLNNFSSSVYLAAYCLSSCFYLVFISGLNWVLHMAEYTDMLLLSDSSCKAWSFVSKMLGALPFWFLVGAAVDRFIAFWYPQRTQTMCSVFIAKLSVVFILASLIVVAIHAMWTMTLLPNGGGCSVEEGNNFRHKFVGIMTIFMLLTVLPSGLLFIIGNLLVFRLCCKHRGRQLQNASSVEVDLSYIVIITSLAVFIVETPGIVVLLVNVFQNIILSHDLHKVTSDITLLGYLLLFPITCAKSSDFRDSLKKLFKDTCSCMSRSNSNIELRLMNGEYNSVPSTSTCV